MTAKTAEPDTATAAVAAFVSEADGPVTPREVAAALDADPDTVGRILRRLEERGVVRKLGRGRYAAADRTAASGDAVTFVCGAFPSLMVVVPDGEQRRFVRFHEGQLTTNDPETIAALDRCESVQRQGADG